MGISSGKQVFVLAAACFAGTLILVSQTGVMAAGTGTADADVDYVSLAAVLVGDGHFDRAAGVLDEVEETTPGLDIVRFLTLKGIVQLHQGAFEEARENLLKAVSLGQKDAAVYLYLAQAAYGMKEYGEALDELSTCGDAALKMAGTRLLAADCHWRLAEYQEAWSELVAGAEAYPDNLEFRRRMIFGLIELGLFQEAVALGTELISDAKATTDDDVNIGEAIRRAGRPADAAAFLEVARLRNPHSTRLLISLAHSYNDSGNPLTAAMLFEQASRLDPAFIADAAEMYRRAGRLEYALLLNGQVDDQKIKLRQRLAILVQLEAFDRAVALLPRLSRLGMLDDQDIVYALAFSFYRTGDFMVAESWLRKLTRPELFNSATALRKAMASCQDGGWSCF